MTAIIQGKRRSLEAAKSRFVTSVNEGVDELMRRCGYSRERATCALLRELGRGDVGATTDDEIFSVMTRYGLGVDDAAHALTVSRAFHRATKERGLTAVEAIDDLLSQLSIKKLVSSSISEPRTTEVLPPRPSEQLRTSPTIAATTSQFTTAQRKGRKFTSTTAKPVHKNGKQKGSKGSSSSKHASTSRKRPSPTNEEGKQGFSSSSSRARADSVTEAVEAKAKKARLSPEEASPSSSDAVMVRAAKRVHRADTDAQSNTV